MKFVAAPLELLFCVIYLITAEGVLWPPAAFFSKTALAIDASDPISAALHAALIGFLAVVSVVRREQVLRAAVRAWPALAVVGLAYVSALWSDAPELVLRRSTTLAATTWFAIYLSARFDMDRIVAILVKVNVFAAIACFAVMALEPRLGFDTLEAYRTAWRGAYTAKNALGNMSAISIIVALYAVWHGYGSRLIAALLILADVVLLHFSQSATPLVLLPVAGYAAMLASAFRRRDALGLILGFALIVVGLVGVGLLAVGWNEFLAALNRGPTLTGRVGIWRLAATAITHRPWLGYGYGAFWRHDSLEARDIWTFMYWTVPHAHNAWLEIGLELGVVGMAAITLLWLAAFYRGVRVMMLPPAEHAVFCLALLAACLVVNITEFEFLRGDSLIWVLFVAAFVYLEQAARVRQNERGTALPSSLRPRFGAVVLSNLPR